MARRMFLIVLACLVCMGHGRRVQSQLEQQETHGRIHPAEESGHNEFQAQSTHLFANPSPRIVSPPSAGVANSGAPTLVTAAKPQMARSTATPAMAAMINEEHEHAEHEHAGNSGKSQDAEQQGEETQQSTQDRLHASAPALFVFLNYIWMGFIGIFQAVGKGNFMDRINRVSNVASILCAIDCTVFPLLLTVLPLVSAVSTGGATAWLHKASHACALWFVAPVGGMAVATNWMQHKRPLVGLWGYTGIAAILLANIHLPHVILGWHVPHAICHGLHEWHSIINVAGCITLLSSQRYAHKLVHCGDCGHDHGHSHSHDCNH